MPLLKIKLSHHIFFTNNTLLFFSLSKITHFLCLNIFLKSVFKFIYNFAAILILVLILVLIQSSFDRSCIFSQNVAKVTKAN